MEELSAVAIVVVVVVGIVLGLLLLILWSKRDDFVGFACIFIYAVLWVKGYWQSKRVFIWVELEKEG